MHKNVPSNPTTKIVSTTAVTLSMQAAFESQYRRSSSFSEAFAAAVSAAPLVHTVPASAWIPIDEARGHMPADDTEVLLLVNGKMYEGLVKWDHPGHEDTYTAYRYFIDIDEHCVWDWSEVTHWMPKPATPAGVIRRDDEPFVKNAPPVIFIADEVCA